MATNNDANTPQPDPSPIPVEKAKAQRAEQDQRIANEISQKLLSNPVMENYSFELEHVK